MSNLAAKCRGELNAQEDVFRHPRCPEQVRAVRNSAYANTYMVYGYYALAQQETDLAHEFLMQCVTLDPSVVVGRPCRLVEFLASYSVWDEARDHVPILETVFAELPRQLVGLRKQYAWAVGYGYLLKVGRAAIWGRLDDPRDISLQARALGVRIDEAFLARLLTSSWNTRPNLERQPHRTPCGS